MGMRNGAMLKLILVQIYQNSCFQERAWMKIIKNVYICINMMTRS